MPITQEAEALALRLLASYPAVPPSRMTVLALAESLDRMGLDIAEPVVERARSEFVRVPSVAQLYEVARQIREEAPETKAQLPMGEFMEQMPGEVRVKIEALHAKWEGLERDYAAEDVEWRRRKAAVMAGPRMAGQPEPTGPLIVDEIPPDMPCDRCGHPSRLHTASDRGSVCRVAGAKVYAPEMVSRRPRATRCWCDGFVPSGVSR